MDVEWDVPTEVVKAYPLTDTSHKLVITPSKYVEPGKIYGVKLNFKNVATDEIVHSEIVQVNVRSSEKAVSAYRPSVRMTVDMPMDINPAEKVAVKVKLENQNLLDLPGLVLRVSSDVSEFEVEQPVELIPLGKKIVELNYNLDPLQEPGDYGVTFDLLEEGEVVESVVKTATITSINPPFNEEEAGRGFFFKTVITKTVTSTSNVKDTQTIKTPTNAIRSLFTSTTPKATRITEDGKPYLAVELTLEPGESRDVIITVSYRILAYLLLIVLIGLFLYYRYKSPLNIRKGVSDVNVKEGGISELKVTLELTSAAKKPIKNVTVTDYVPNIADIEKEFGEGTLRPSRIFKHKTKGTILKWELDEIAPGEDRLISYSIKSKLSIVGDFKVPRAKVGFKKKGRDITSYSNQVEVSS